MTRKTISIRTRRIAVFVALFLCITPLFVAHAETVAYTHRGMKVTLHDDGTWSRITNRVHTFRKTWWGMTKAEVAASETNLTRVDESEAYLAYTGIVNTSLRYQCNVYYYFVSGTLASASYSFPLAGQVSYEQLRDLLIRVYGTPQVSIDAGEMKNAQWTTNGTTISLLFSPKTATNTVFVHYYSMLFRNLESAEVTEGF